MRAWIILSVLALLTAQIEFAAEGRAATAGDEAAATTHNHPHVPDHGTPGDAPGADNCNHCCHSAAHLTGIATDHRCTDFRSPHILSTVCPDGFTTLADPPPIRPPIA